MRYCGAFKKWLAWDGKRFAVDDSGEVMRRAKAMVRKQSDTAWDLGDEEKTTALLRDAARSSSLPRLKAMIELASTELSVVARPEDFDQKPWLLNVGNGVIDLQTGLLCQRDREHLHTKVVKVEFDQLATAPVWAKFLDTVTGGNVEMKSFLQRAVGYTLTGSTKEQVLFLLYGNGSNGKTTFLEAVRTITGDYGSQADFNTFLKLHNERVRDDIAILRGSRFVSAVEADAGKRLDESMIKQLTGGDRITARHLYGEYFEFHPQFKIWLGANHLPEVHGSDYGIWRRLLAVPFDVQIPAAELDRDLGDKLRDEASGILAWAVRGCLEWQRIGLNPPEKVTQSGSDYRMSMDPVTTFVAEVCQTGPGLRSLFRRLVDEYEGWAKDEGHRSMNNREFSKRLTELGYPRIRGGKGVSMREGIELLHGLEIASENRTSAAAVASGD